MNFKLHFEIVLFWTIFCLIGLSQSGHPLQSYINDNSDISVLNYTLLQTNYFFTHDVYILNVTSLKWFDGKIIVKKPLKTVKIDISGS